MYDIHSRPGTSYGRGLIILLATSAMGLFLGGAVSILIWFGMTGKGLASMEANMNNPTFLNALRVMQLVSTFFIFFVPAVIMAYVLSKKPFRLLGFNFYFSSKQIVLVILIMLAALPLVGALGELNKLIPVGKDLEMYFKAMEDRYAETVKLLANINSPGAYILALLIMALAPAIFEETLFRGALQNLLQKISQNPWISIGISSVIFSAIHMSFYGFLPRFALGVVLGLIFHYSGSLWLAIIAHFFNNALVVTQIYIYTRQGKSVEDAMNETFPLWWGLIGIAVLMVLFKFYKEFAAEDRKIKVPAETVALEDQWMT
jgi:membrane protease YdiL (CAAX protease family)